MAQAQAVQQPPASASKPLATGTATVVVACKVPQGHRARLFQRREVQTVTPGGIVQSVIENVPTGEEFVFKGPQHGQNEGPRVTTVSGFALTFGVPADFWDRWYDQHKSHDLVRSGLIFAHARQDNVKGEAKEKKGLTTGFERIDPTRSARQSGVKVETSPELLNKLGRLDSDEE